jgi:dolichyl-diphosphooligosaccharide--protein glycosyltransferase
MVKKILPDFGKGDPSIVLLIVWSVVMLVTNLSQRRFGYYYAVNVSILVGCLSWKVLELTSFKRVEVKKRRKSKSTYPTMVNFATKSVVILVVFFVVIFPSALLPVPNSDKSSVIATASGIPYLPSNSWCETLDWIKGNTPDPFNNPDYYNQVYKDHTYLETSYGVLSWWDYGYWITRLSHRLPSSNPSQDPQVVTRVASFFTSQSEEEANEVIRSFDASYLIVDKSMAYEKFWAIITWAGLSSSEYFDTYYQVKENNQVEGIRLFYSRYYNSMAVRLYSFEGKEVVPTEVYAILYQEQSDEVGNTYKILTNVIQYTTYEEAEEFLLSEEGKGYSIVSPDPALSPIPLKALEDYKLIHSSEDLEVKVFEVVEKED